MKWQSWVLFNTEMEQVITDMQIKTTVTAHNKKFDMTAYTDGIVIVQRLQKCRSKR
jgi:hypothetical protein